MAFPDPVKTYQWSLNQLLRSKGSVLEDNRQLMFVLKASLCGFGTQPWTVVKSSNSTSAGASDYWAAHANLVWGTGAHSWIVLANAGFGNFQVCIDLNVANNYQCTTVYSANAGFVATAGTTSARPTATDEVVYASAATWHGFGTGVFDCVLHAAKATDSEVTRVWAQANSACGLFVSFDKADAPVTGWAYPRTLTWIGAVPNYTNLNDVANCKGYQGGAMPMYLTSEGYSGVMLNESYACPSHISGEHRMSAAGLVSETAGKRGRHGAFFDLFWGSTLWGDGRLYPASAKTWVSVGALVVPWDPLVVPRVSA